MTPVFSLNVPFEIVTGLEPGLNVPVTAFPSYFNWATTWLRSNVLGPHSPVHVPEIVSAANRRPAIERQSTEESDIAVDLINSPGDKIRKQKSYHGGGSPASTHRAGRCHLGRAAYALPRLKFCSHNFCCLA